MSINYNEDTKDKNSKIIPTKFFGLGGMQEIGKSTLVIEHASDIVIIDSGVKFADIFTTGVKGMIPDYSYLQKNQNKIKGLFITHGHEDHIGGIVYLIQQVHIKTIFAPRIAIQYLRARMDEFGLKIKIKFIEIEKDAVHTFDHLSVDFWTAQHSIPDAFGIRVSSKNGSLMLTGDFRFDYTPIGNYTDFSKLKQIGNENLTALFSDSTNAMRPSHSPSEKDILKDIEYHIKNATKKVIITAFASNLTRIKAIIDLGIKLDKKIVTFGRSMINGVKIGRKIGYINSPDNIFIDKKNISKYDPNEILILTTGSQGEQLAALDKMSYNKHPHVKIGNKDVIIFSSSPIPGNRIKIELLINRLYKLNAIIKENGSDGYLHTSGHAYKEEHEKIFELTKPKYFFPYHGEYRMCLAHKQTAIESGIKATNVIIPDLGEVYEMVNQKITKSKEVITTGPVYIDGYVVSTANSQILKEREELRENGFVFILTAIDKKTNSIIGRSKVISRGAFFAKSSKNLLNEIRRLVHGAILFTIKNESKWDIPQLKQLIKNRLTTFFYKEKRKKPVILSSFLFVDEKYDFLQDYAKTLSFEINDKS